jgi:thiol-disulfide isomerase/thioredoxin
MNLPKLHYLILLFCLFWLSIAQRSKAQIQTGTAPASDAEIKAAKTAVEADLNNIKAHKAFIYAMNIANPLLPAQYRQWMEKYPNNPNIPLALGTVYVSAEMPGGKEFLLRAATIQPRNAQTWFLLANDAWFSGDSLSNTQYLQKATLADPTSALYAYGYLKSVKDKMSADTYEQTVFELASKFHGDQIGAMALYILADDEGNVNKKVNILEKLRSLYPPAKYAWSSSGMINLADIYLQQDPQNALTLINGMGNGKDWMLRKQIAETLISANQLAQAQQYNEALAQMNRLTLPRFNFINDFMAITKAGLQDKAGQTQAAYDSLATNFAKLPTDDLYLALKTYGHKIGKDSMRMVSDINHIRSQTLTDAYPFELGLYTSNKKLSLNDLKGKVTLLTFWFPGCSPCRKEFPYFEAVMQKFKHGNVAYVGINVTPEQDAFVLPAIKSNRWSFTPLRGTEAFAAEHFNVRGEPTNFLINKNGKIVFKNFRIDQYNQRTLELMISSLL